MNPIHEEIKQLLRGPLAPDGAWIEVGKVSGRNFIQAYWRSNTPIFEGKRRKYIGKAGSPKHQEAITAQKNSDRLRSLQRQTKILGEKK